MRQVNAHAMIVGAGPMEQTLRRQVRRLGLGERVHFAGPVSDEELPAYVAAADVGVLPSTRVNEVFGLSQIEMMASGVPMIATELGTGTSFVNQHGESGLIVKPDDPAALADALNLLLADPTLRRRLGDGARERAHRLFTVEAMMKGVDAAYRVALERHRTRGA
jgi:rhamnosyl/mannosyltransferase